MGPWRQPQGASALPPDGSDSQGSSPGFFYSGHGLPSLSDLGRSLLSAEPFFLLLFKNILVALGLCCGTRVSLVACSLVVVCGHSCPTAYVISVLWPGIKPESPALEGGFLTTGLPGKFPGSPFLDPRLQSGLITCGWQGKTGPRDSAFLSLCCGLEQVTSPLCASVSSSVKWG